MYDCMRERLEMKIQKQCRFLLDFPFLHQKQKILVSFHMILVQKGVQLFSYIPLCGVTLEIFLSTSIHQL